MLHGHGDDIHNCKKVQANFSTNIYYKSNNSILHSYIKENLDCINSYPEPDARSLKIALGEFHKIESNNFIIGNGATEIFYLVAQYHKNKKTLIVVPSFAEYEDACRLHNHNIEFTNLEEIDKYDNSFDLIIICNPNNPNGFVYSKEVITNLLEKFTKSNLLIDEAFIDFIDEDISSIDLIKEYPRLIISRSMTKNYAIPGLRLGYLIGDKNIISEIEKYKQPWSVNSIAIEIGKFALKNHKSLLPDANLLNSDRLIFTEEINKIEGFECLPSSTPFFLVKTKYNSSRLKEYLKEKHLILIRDASNFRSLDNHYFRLNCLDKRRNNLLINALKEYHG
ncbi:aminotransferase class I/II-fold pyridoxal phosphate-dependent enzyme [Marinilabiliaceae bacterium JC040]|nr:aminotransferase class I/II-fold pyridoxal phosphate-dependent enzyme [Marinilabiliaceae bacterium JC040]